MYVRVRRVCTPRVYVRTRFQVNYSIIAVDILLFVAVVDRRPAAESGIASDPFRAARILAMSRELLLARLPTPVRCRGRDRYFCKFAIRYSASVDLHNL